MKISTPPLRWVCPSCQHENSALTYCPACGEQYLAPDGLTLHALAAQALASLFHADGRILRTVRVLLLEPGRLTRAWMHGERRRWVAPFQLFLFLNVIFFFSESLSGLSVLAVPFNTHLHHMQYSPLARRLVDSYLLHHGGTLASLTPLFEAQQTTNAKLLVFAMVPLFALALRLLFPLRRRQGAIHLVFALHFYAYLMVCLTLLFPILGLVLLLLHHLSVAIDSDALDYVVSLIELALIVVYLWPSLRRVYSLAMPRLIGSVVVLASSVLPILIAYRLFLFWVTLHGLRGA
jgi:hypothetical protein